jgi:hypothetical protein
MDKIPENTRHTFDRIIHFTGLGHFTKEINFSVFFNGWKLNEIVFKEMMPLARFELHIYPIFLL